MKTRLTLAMVASSVAIGAALFVGCHTDRFADLRDQMKTGEQRWTAQKATNYSYIVKIGSFSPPEVTSPVVVTIKDGKPYSIVYVSDGKPATNTSFQRVDTIEELFSIVRAAIDNKYDAVSASFDASLGYPTQISLNPREDAFDDESGYTVTNLKISP